MPLKGVVWDASVPPTVTDLLRIHSAGVEAIRLPATTDHDLLLVADTLGLQLFQDLPINFLPAGALLDTLEYAKSQLSLSRELARLYPSAHRFGVSTKSNTRNPHACEYYRELAEWAPELVLYYTSAFVSDDQCSSHVDLVLLDSRRESDPTEVLDRWSSSTPVGLSSVGQKVVPDQFGLRQTYSPESQARFLENHLPPLLESKAKVIFVYRWQDNDKHISRWGLIDKEGKELPAFEVLRGIYTGTQQIFAFDFGDHPPREIPWPRALTWIAILLLAFLNLWCDRFSNLMWDYANPYISREMLYHESAFPPDVSLTYVTAQGFLLSGVVLILIEAFRDLAPIDAITPLLSPYLLEQVSNLTSNFYLLSLVVISIYLIINLISCSLAVLIARRLQGVMLEHFFTINAMNHTPLGAVVPMVLIAPSLDGAKFNILSIVLACSWAFLRIYCIIRSAYSFATLTRNRLINMGTLGLMGVPLLLLTGLIITLCLPYTREYIIFWWHLIFSA